MKITISLFAGRKRIDELLRANNALVEEKRAANKSIAIKRDLISSYLSRSSRDAAEIRRLQKEIYRLTASAAASTPADDARNMAEPSRSASPDGIMASDGFGKPIIFGPTAGHDPDYVEPIGWRSLLPMTKVEGLPPNLAELLAKIEGIVWAPNPPPPTVFAGMFWLGADGEPHPEPTTDEILRRGVGDSPISAK